MLDFSSTTMGFKSFSSKPQPSLDDPEMLDLARILRCLFIEHGKLEVTNDSTYLILTNNLLNEYSTFEKVVEKIMTLSHESSLRPLHAYEPSSSKSPHHSSSSKSHHDSSKHHSHASSSMSSSSTRSPSSSSSWSDSSSTSPKSPTPKISPHCVLVLTVNGTSHCIDCDGDPYDSNFEQEFDDFCRQYLDDTFASLRKRNPFIMLISMSLLWESLL